MASLLLTRNHSLLLREVRRHVSRRAYHVTLRSNNAAGGGHHLPPPLPPFARSPASFEKITENKDCVWDDGVAPELALDFDAPNVSSREALWTLLGVLGLFVLYYHTVVTWTFKENPALEHRTDIVVPDYANWEVPKK